MSWSSVYLNNRAIFFAFIVYANLTTTKHNNISMCVLSNNQINGRETHSGNLIWRVQKNYILTVDHIYPFRVSIKLWIIVRIWKNCTHAANEKTQIKCLIVFSLWKIVEIPNSNFNYAMWKIGGRKGQEGILVYSSWLY